MLFPSKKIRVIIKLTFLLIIVQFFLWTPKISLAEPSDPPQVSNLTPPDIKVGIPKFKGFSGIYSCDSGFICIPWIGEYIFTIYNYLIGSAGILSAVMLMLGGFIWATAAGDSGKIGEAKGYISGAILGLVLTMTAQTILQQVNSELGSIKAIKIKAIDAKSVDTSLFSQITSAIADITGTGTGGSPQANDVQKFCKWKDAAGASCSETFGQGWMPREITGVDGQNCDPTTKDNSVCCCLKFGGGWRFDSGIQAQMKDASPDLIELLACLRPQLPAHVGVISSISDSHGLANCQNNYDDGCAHGKNSCHYGKKSASGKKEGLSQAVDFGDEQNKAAYDRAFAVCKSKISLALFEGNHYHVSSAACVGR